MITVPCLVNTIQMCVYTHTVTKNRTERNGLYVTGGCCVVTAIDHCLFPIGNASAESKLQTAVTNVTTDKGSIP